MQLQSTRNEWVSKSSGSSSLVGLDVQWVLETLMVSPSALVPIPCKVHRHGTVSMRDARANYSKLRRHTTPPIEAG
jgi:hypothetical protein